MLTCLLQRTVGTCNNQDRTVHLCCTCDHVLDIVCVSGAVHVCVVTFFRLILNVTGIDGNTSFLLFGCIIDLRIIHKFVGAVHQRKIFGDRSSQRGFTMVNVANGTNVYMGFGSFEFRLSHFHFLLNIWMNFS